MNPAKIKCAHPGCDTYIMGGSKSGVCFRHAHSARCRCDQCRGVAPIKVLTDDGFVRAYRVKTREELGLPPEGAWREWHGGELLPPWEVARRAGGAA